MDSRPRISRACILRELFVYDEWWEVRLREIIRQRSELVVVGHGVGYCWLVLRLGVDVGDARGMLLNCWRCGSEGAMTFIFAHNGLQHVPEVALIPKLGTWGTKHTVSHWTIMYSRPWLKRGRSKRLPGPVAVVAPQRATAGAALPA